MERQHTWVSLINFLYNSFGAYNPLELKSIKLEPFSSSPDFSIWDAIFFLKLELTHFLYGIVKKYSLDFWPLKK